jgi:hypothetical protein
MAIFLECCTDRNEKQRQHASAFNVPIKKIIWINYLTPTSASSEKGMHQINAFGRSIALSLCSADAVVLFATLHR